MDIKIKVNILLNILSELCELAERDATFFLPQKGNEIDYEESVRYLVQKYKLLVGELINGKYSRR